MESGIDLWDVGEIAGLNVRVTLSRSHLPLMKKICQTDGAKVKLLRSAGLFRILRQAVRRPVLVLGCLLIVILSLYLPGRVLFVEVEGVGDVPVDRILFNAEMCGLYFGADRGDIRSERVKNALLEAVPELQWVGVNTYGCRAVISVRLRTQVQQEETQQGISSIVALRDGVVRQMTVLQGSPVCKVGQSVAKGQVLISGYSDLGICIRGTHAEGEVFGETRRTVTAIAPTETLRQDEISRHQRNYGLIFGKFRINFFKGSGISGATCDKMYLYQYMTLPGGFRLPVALVVEETIWYDVESQTIDETEAATLLHDCAGGYVYQQMIAGRIDNRYEIVTELDGACYQVGKYACYELIGVSRPEEDLGTNEINGTNGERGAG